MKIVDDLLDELMRVLQAKTGLSTTLLALGGVVVVAAVITVVFLCAAAYIWLAQHYGDLNAALWLGCGFLVLTLASVIACVIVRRRTIARAMAARHAWWADPTVMAIGVQLGRSIGWRKLVPLAVVSALAAGLARSRANGA
jgi:hypothetical protein